MEVVRKGTKRPKKGKKQELPTELKLGGTSDEPVVPVWACFGDFHCSVLRQTCRNDSPYCQVVMEQFSAQSVGFCRREGETRDV